MTTLFDLSYDQRRQHSTWRIGVIGAGRIVERAHLPVLYQMPDVEVVGIFDPDQERAQRLARQFSLLRVLPRLEELFNLDLDIVVVACPNHLHASMSIMALQAKLHVLCEKPMALNLAEAEAMVAAVERGKRKLMIAFANRFRPEIAALHRAIHEKQLGQIKSIRCGWLRRQGVPDAGTWFTRQALAGGGVLTDLGSHMLDLALWLSGCPRVLTTSCALDRTLNPHAGASWYATPEVKEVICDVEISANGFIVCEGPLDIFIEVSWDTAVPYDQTYIHVVGTEGVAHLETLFGFSPLGHRPEYPLSLWREGQPIAQTVMTASDLLQPFRDQWRFFIDHLNAADSPREGLRDNLATVQVIEALYRSAGSPLAIHT